VVEEEFFTDWVEKDDSEKLNTIRRQFRLLLPALRERALEANTSREDYHHQFLTKAWQLTDALYDALHSNCNDTTLPLAEKPRGFWYHQTFDWFRTHDPTRGFRIYKEELVGTATNYVSQPQIWTNKLDWIFLDALVFTEIEAFAEAIGSNNAGTGTNWARIFAGRSQGKYWALKLVFGIMGLTFALGWGPVLAWYLAGKNHEVAALVALAVWAILSVWRLATYPIRRRVRRKAVNLLNRMLELYRLLGDSTISPRRLREALDAATKEGVVLEGSVFAIVDRIVARDPTVFLPG
jgi:hypothetical protein